MTRMDSLIPLFQGEDWRTGGWKGQILRCRHLTTPGRWANHQAEYWAQLQSPGPCPGHSVV